MPAGPVGMAVHQPVRTAAAQCGQYRGWIGIHDLRLHAPGVLLAARARRPGQHAPRRERQTQKALLPRAASHLRAQPLIGDIARAQQVAVRNQHTLAIEVDDCRVRQQHAAGRGGETVTEQEVAVAVHDEDRHALRSELADGVENQFAVRVQVIVADPRLEQIAQDVERISPAGSVAQKLRKLQSGCRPGRIEVQVRYKQGRHFVTIVRVSIAAVVTRFAPSPTGELHLGNARTALFNALYARASGGRFVLRIEDTDLSRSTEAHVQALTADLAWLGLDWQLGPGRAARDADWRQSLRGDIYAAHFQRLQQQGLVYPCYCTPLELDLARRAQLASGQPPRYAGTCRRLSAAERHEREARGLQPTLRFAVPEGAVLEFTDLVHGEQRVRASEIGDFIIRRAEGTAAFFFCNAIDDALMGITHVLRGEDHLSNTPRQMLILRALGLPVPRYGHLSLLTGSDGAPLSKRHGATTLRELREAGFGAAAINNLLFRLGHSTAVNDFLSLGAMAASFDARHLQRASAHFDPAQLRYWQSEWLRRLTPDESLAWARAWMPGGLPAQQQQLLLAAVLPNVVTAAELRDWLTVLTGAAPRLEDDARLAVEAAGAAFFASASDTAREQLGRETPAAVRDGKALLEALRAATGTKGAAFFKPLRAALTGRLHGPELVPMLMAMSSEAIVQRLAAHSAMRPAA
jgi:glutamyl-tRNA synthetase